jgi:energy-coupling factor transporter ATP-binding protein EcfA2
LSEPLRVFLSYHDSDRDEVELIYAHLSKEGYKVWMQKKDLLPGQPLQLKDNAIRNADAVLFCIGFRVFEPTYNYRDLTAIREEIKERQPDVVFLVPILLDEEEIPLPLDLANINPVCLYEDDGYRQLADALRLVKRRPAARPPQPTPSRNLQVQRITLTNISCFEELDLSFEASAGSARWTMLVGDNAAGKTTLLRCLALGLCSESDAVALMREVPGSFVRKGAEEGVIDIYLQDTLTGEEFAITTRIIKSSEGNGEIVRKSTQPEEGFPWSDVFVCGYGTQRTSQAHASFDRYSARDAVETLFSDTASLQNPEVVLLRQPADVRAGIEQRLLEVLMLSEGESELAYPSSGLEIRGPWGSQQLPALSDGYRSTAQWVLDLFSWLILAGRHVVNGEVGGILLIDEVEQHLHPRWQRYIAQRLHQQLPRTQIIASTHTPLVAAGIVDVADSLLIRLSLEDDGSVSHQVVDMDTIDGRRADQVLASDAFGLVTSRNPGSETLIHRYTELLGRKKRSADEEQELQELGARLEAALQTGENELERAVEQAVGKTLREMALQIDPELLDLEARRQLQEIFGNGSKGSE